MPGWNENRLSALLREGSALRLVEPQVYSVLPDENAQNVYDTGFGLFYDRVACSRLYNRLVWGYSIGLFAQTAQEALGSAAGGTLLDLGCGSLAFTAKAYSQYSGAPVVLVDQSLKMLRMAKSRLIKMNGKPPGNLALLQADALELPFRANSFSAVLCENLLHCLEDAGALLGSLKTVLRAGGEMYFTTLVKAHRPADGYLACLAKSGKLVSRTMEDHQAVFAGLGIAGQYSLYGNLATIRTTRSTG